MGISLPYGSTIQLPPVPEEFAKKNPDLYVYLNKLRVALEQFTRNQFTNESLISNAVNLGTSGNFAIASGGHILVTSGIVISVSTT